MLSKLSLALSVRGSTLADRMLFLTLLGAFSALFGQLIFRFHPALRYEVRKRPERVRA